MNKKRTLQNNLSYALKYMFDNYGINIFLDAQKFIVTLKNLIPNLDEEIKLVEYAIEKNAVSAIINANGKRDIDKNFAYLRAKTILTKNGISEKTALYIVDCFSYALSWIDEIPDYEDLSDIDFKISKNSLVMIFTSSELILILALISLSASITCPSANLLSIL